MTLFESIANDLYCQGYSIQKNALPWESCLLLAEAARNSLDNVTEVAGIGRNDQLHANTIVRSDHIRWIDGNTSSGQAWLAWAAELKTELNRRLFLGLFSFESHFARYRPGAFYRRHLDAFKGEKNRIVSVVIYLNENWHGEDGGELIIYHLEHHQIETSVLPEMGTVVIFLSEDFPHEVMPATRDRFSIAGWFRVNTSSGDRVDPPT